MVKCALSLAVATLAATPAAAEPPRREQQVRFVFMPPPGKALEVFVDSRQEVTGVVFPLPIQHVDADRGATVRVEPWDAARLQVEGGPGAHAGPRVRVTLADETRLTLRLVVRANIRDTVLNVHPRPDRAPEQSALLAQERLLRCQPLAEQVADKARQIAAHGSEAVFSRATGSGFVFKQTNRLSLSFVDVVHDGGISYATLVIENRSRAEWPVALEELSLLQEGGREVRIIARAAEVLSVPPGKSARLVVAYETPGASTLTVLLREGGVPSLMVGVIP